MPSRRSVLTGIAAACLCPAPTWAEAGSPATLSAGRRRDGRHVLCGLSGTGQILFDCPLPARGHAAAAHPTLAQAVAFARRPGTFAIVLDCMTGEVLARLQSPKARHFYGHGAFSGDGGLLFTTENDYEAGHGVIGVWDARRGYARIGEFSSGGTGPHDIRLMPDGGSLVVANGGIETHPDMGRTKLNIPTMRPNLSYVSLAGDVLEVVELPPDRHKNSIRHLAVAENGTVAFAMQWQGDQGVTPPMLGLHKQGTAPVLARADRAQRAALRGYAGSVALTRDARQVAITSPRGSICQIYTVGTGALLAQHELEDVCGVAPVGDGFQITSGTGELAHLTAERIDRVARHTLQWDNHLVALGG